MSEKMKCARCGKRFKQANRKQVLCADCLAKERAAKKSGAQLVPSATGYATSITSQRVETAAPPSRITIIETTPPPEIGAFGSQARRAERQVPQAPERPPHTPPHSPHTPQPAQPAPKTQGPAALPAQPVPSQQIPRKPAPQPEKRVRPPKPATPPFALTNEMRGTIERRYLELSQPVEFDGIRTQIAGELQVPKPVVKQVIRELRASRQLPSWWELQAYKGNDEILERIRARYLPLLPVPPVGVHKQIASELQMDAPQVYQAIRRLRAEMKLPQYNPPEAHAGESGETPPPATAGGATANAASESSASASAK